MRTVHARRFAVIAGATMLTSSFAAAASFYTPVASPPGGEATLEAIFENSFGGDFSPSGVNFSNGAINATRVADAIDTLGVGGTRSGLTILTESVGVGLNIDGTSTANETDQTWLDGTVNSSAEAKFAGYNQSFGLFVDPAVVVQWSTTSDGFNPGQTSNAAFSTGSPFTWGRSGDGSSTAGNVLPWSSLEADNASEEAAAGARLDHMITFKITTAAGGFLGWMLFFDDQVNPATDRDFNDLAVYVTVVPLPPAVLAGLPLLGLAWGVNAKRRRAMAV